MEHERCMKFLFHIYAKQGNYHPKTYFRIPTLTLNEFLRKPKLKRNKKRQQEQSEFTIFSRS